MDSQNKGLKITMGALICVIGFFWSQCLPQVVAAKSYKLQPKLTIALRDSKAREISSKTVESDVILKFLNTTCKFTHIKKLRKYDVTCKLNSGETVIHNETSCKHKDPAGFSFVVSEAGEEGQRKYYITYFCHPWEEA